MRTAEAEHEPAILEAFSFRFRGHSVIDADRYRDPEEIKRGRAADPITLLTQQLLEAQVVDNTWLKETAARVERDLPGVRGLQRLEPRARRRGRHDLVVGPVEYERRHAGWRGIGGDRVHEIGETG